MSVVKFQTRAQQLRAAGWKKWGESSWWKPLPEWRGRMAFCQRLYCESEAYKEMQKEPSDA